MATRRIEVDDEVYAELERHARGFEKPNDVLRRRLGLSTPQPATTTPKPHPPRRRGRLSILLDSGHVSAGDTLTHHQPRKHQTFAASVDSDGWITTPKGSYDSPSPALRDLVGSQIDGWANWVHDRTGRTLKDLRDTLGSSTR